jgi:hypothetical protein
LPSIAENLAAVQARIQRAAERAGRAPGSVLLVAVTKTQPPERVREAYAAGQRHFAENRVQEFEQKRPLLELPGSEWHLVGHLQSNKAHRAVQLFDVIETVDSERLARRLDEAKEQLLLSAGDRNGGGSDRLPVFLEVKLSAEPAKTGCSEEELPELTRRVLEFQHLRLLGLMTMPPFTEDPEEARPYFRRLREWAGRLGLCELSMGMTSEFEVAIEEGATLVRIGTAIFGERH